MWTILKPTIKSYMSHYISNWEISCVSTQRMHQRVQRNNSPGIHSDVHRCTFRCSPGELFIWYALWYTLGMLKKQGYMAYVSLWIPLIWGVKVLHKIKYFEKRAKDKSSWPKSVVPCLQVYPWTRALANRRKVSGGSRSIYIAIC